MQQDDDDNSDSLTQFDNGLEKSMERIFAPSAVSGKRMGSAHFAFPHGNKERCIISPSLLVAEKSGPDTNFLQEGQSVS